MSEPRPIKRARSLWTKVERGKSVGKFATGDQNTVAG
ncbi:hypothetical protein AYI68_g8187, partial [Smittium mucronatum]